MSLYLPEQKLGSHSAEGSSSNKFMLKGRQTGSMHRGHSWVFRAESYETMLAWFEDIKILTEKSPQERNAFVRRHARSVSGTSQKAGSVSSDGMMDEEDEEPFSAAASAVATQGPKQDELPRRPQPGGRFPSADLIVNQSRGLQAPLSPSSGSSGFGDVQDRDVVTAAGASLGSGIGQHYGNESATSPTHAAMVNQYSQQDGINPYTSQPIHNQHESHIPVENDTAGLASARLGGAILGAAGTTAYFDHKHDKATELEEQAALESAQVAAPDTYVQNFEAQAAREAALIAAPDTRKDIPSDDHIMSGGRSQRNLPGHGAEQVSNPNDTVSGPLTEDTRPAVAGGQTHSSTHGVSQLHIPGEFPRQTPA